jgi:hypothetical protein
MRVRINTYKIQSIYRPKDWNVCMVDLNTSGDMSDSTAVIKSGRSPLVLIPSIMLLKCDWRP